VNLQRMNNKYLALLAMFGEGKQSWQRL